MRIVFRRGGSFNGWSRRHYRGPDNMDVWLFDRRDDSFARLTTHRGNDGDARWGGPRTLLYLSDRELNCINLYRMSAADGEQTSARLTAFTEHDVHGFEMDREGKDTYRHFHSGADGVLISSPNKLALIKRVEKQPSLDELIDRYHADMDIVITEGFKRLNKPKIEVFRSAAHSEPLCKAADNRIALVSDISIEVDCPRFDIDDAEAVADFIEERFLKSTGNGQ